MNIITELRYTADLDRGVNMTPLHASFLAGNQEAHRFLVSCTRSGLSADLTGAGVHGYFIRADGATVLVDGTAEGDTASVLLPASCYAVQGRFSLVINVSDGDTVNTVLWAEGAVSRSRTDLVFDPEEAIPTLDELLARIDAMRQATEEAIAAAESITPFTLELTDARTDVDGNTYDSAGEAIRANQIPHSMMITDDLNNYTQPMWAVVSSTAANIPYKASGIVVIERVGVGYGWVVQRYFAADFRKSYWRSKKNQADWSAWSDYSIIDHATLIGDDLNNYTQPMWAVCQANAANIPPTGQSGVLVVERVDVASGWVLQRYFSANDASSYWRTWRNSVWSEWHATNRAEYGIYIAAGTDLNTITPDEYYYGISDLGALNAPEAATHHGMLALIPFSSGPSKWYTQLWIETDFSAIYGRVCRNDVWTAWDALYRRGAAGERKTVVFMGDSIFGNNQSPTGVVNLFADRTGHACHNFAFGGSRAKKRGNAWDPFDAEELCKAIVSGDFSVQESALADNDFFPPYFPGSLEKLKAFDFSTADLLIIDWGTNDWYNGNTHAAYFEALTNFIRTMQTAYPKLRIFKMTPPQRFFALDDGTVENGNNHLRYGVTLREFVEQEGVIQRDFNIPVIDMYNAGINILNYTTFFDGSDLTHQNANGRRVIADKLANEIC